MNTHIASNDGRNSSSDEIASMAKHGLYKCNATKRSEERPKTQFISPELREWKITISEPAREPAR